jgi:hypothetical protein
MVTFTTCLTLYVPIFKQNKQNTIIFNNTACEGCFCNNATWRAEGDHDVGFDIEKKG